MKLNATLFSAFISSSVLFCLVFAIAPPTVRSAPSSPKHLFRGIAPGDEDYYKSSDVIQCKDGSKKFTKDQLNDDFCDCPDGTDEPGTSACPHGKFYCQNAGHVPLILFSSMVNDGICDCCDGSDEYNHQVKCANTCWEAGKVARDKLNKKIATYQEGSKVRKQEVEYAKEAIAKDEAELLKLKNEEKILKGLVQQLKERKEQIERAEEKERLRKEKEEKEKKEAEEKASIGKGKAEEDPKQEKDESVNHIDGEDKPTKGDVDDKSRHGAGSPSDQDVIEDHVDVAAEVQHINTPENQESSLNVEEQGKILPETTEELTREELGRLVASRWTGKDTGKETEEVDSSKADYNSLNGIPKDSDDEEDDGYASETDDDSQKHEEDLEDETDRDHREEDLDDSSSSYRYDSDVESDFSDVDISTNPSWLEKIQQTMRNVLQAVNIFQAPVNQSDAAFVRKEYDESSAKLSKIQARISSLTQKQKHDFGPEKSFYSFYGRCFESKQNKYVYKVCPYKQASQIEGHSTTRLGQWDKFEDSYRFMIFSNGDRCWNGPDRSLKVRLRCGLKNEITDVDEPSRCEYVALLSTPAVCLEEILQELQQKLDSMNQEPQKHDEL